MRRISLVPAPISYSFASRRKRPVAVHALPADAGLKPDRAALRRLASALADAG